MNKFNLNSSLKNKLVILLYHGVTEDENTGIINYQGKHINHIEFYHSLHTHQNKVYQ